MDKLNKVAGGGVLMVKVYSYDGKNIKGILYDVSRNLRYSYYSMTQLILRINEILDTSDAADVTKQDIFESARHEGRFDIIAIQICRVCFQMESTVKIRCLRAL